MERVLGGLIVALGVTTVLALDVADLFGVARVEAVVTPEVAATSELVVAGLTVLLAILLAIFLRAFPCPVLGALAYPAGCVRGWPSYTAPGLPSASFVELPESMDCRVTVPVLSMEDRPCVVGLCQVLGLSIRVNLRLKQFQG